MQCFHALLRERSPRTVPLTLEVMGFQCAESCAVKEGGGGRVEVQSLDGCCPRDADGPVRVCVRAQEADSVLTLRFSSFGMFVAAVQGGFA